MDPNYEIKTIVKDDLKIALESLIRKILAWSGMTPFNLVFMVLM